jgi:hypothetical protein
VFYAIHYKHSLIHQHRLDEYLHFHDHAWKRNDDRLDYRYWLRLRLRLRLDHAIRQDRTHETGKLYRTAPPWRRWLHRANVNRKRHIRH